MKKLVFVFVSLFVLVAAAKNVSAQNNATATATASAKIIAPLAIEKIGDLSFGNIVKSSTGGTVAIATDGMITYTGGLSKFGTTLGTVTAAAFKVAGEDKAKYTIQLPTADVALTRDGGGATMTIKKESFNHNAGTNPKIEGEGNFNVGATLSVAADQQTGTYNGSFNVTVAYE